MPPHIARHHLTGRRAFLTVALCLVTAPVSGQVHTAGEVTLEPGTIEHFGTTYDVEYGSLWVPMNRQDPGTTVIQLKFIRYKSTSPDPGPPIVYLAGGPGGSGIGTMRSSRGRAFLAFLDEYDFIAFDQRGTGDSEPRDLRLDFEVMMPLDEPASPEAYVVVARDVARKTLAMLDERGVDPWGLTTEQSADDLDALRSALGVEKLILWGSSYGTHLSLAVARRHPEAVAAMILAGTEGPDHSYKLPSNIQKNLERLGELVEQDPVYGELMPDFVGTVRQVLDDLEANPRTITLIPGLTITVGKWDLQRALSRPMGSRGTMQEIPAAIYAMSHGEYFKLATTAYGARRLRGYSAMSLCMDCASWSTDQRLRQIQRETPQTLLGAVIDFPFPAICDVEGMPRLGDEFRSPLHSDIPTLFISGTVDGRTPISNAREIAEGFTNHRELVIRGASHGADLFTSTPEIIESVKLFLRGETLPAAEIDGPDWEFEPPFRKSLEREMLEILTGEGYDAAVARYLQIREQFEDRDVYDFREEVLNKLGYAVMRGGVKDVDLAIDIFRLNTAAYPEAFNTWDSLGEAYAERGDVEKAIASYEKSVELNPDNDNGQAFIDRLRQDTQ